MSKPDENNEAVSSVGAEAGVTDTETVQEQDAGLQAVNTEAKATKLKGERPRPPQVVIVTGGARGIGYACVKKFLKRGDRVVIADNSAEAGREALERFSDFGDRVIFVACDVSDKLAVHNLLAQTLTAFGGVDILVNNAGIYRKGGALDLKLKDFDAVLAVNLRGAFLVSQTIAQHMVQSLEENDDRSGRHKSRYCIVNISSINAQVAIADGMAYAVSKGGLAQLTRSMALELAPYGIRVNSVGPGSIKTDMLAGVAQDPSALEVIHSRTPLGRIGHPKEIASIVAFLASRDASYITGENIVADGGRMALNYVMPIKDTET